MNLIAWIERTTPLFIAIGVPGVFYLLDLLLRDGFRLGTRDAGADLALVAAAGSATLALERRGSNARAQFGMTLLLATAWIASLWCLRHEGDGWTLATIALGLVASTGFVRAVSDPDNLFQ